MGEDPGTARAAVTTGQAAPNANTTGQAAPNADTTGQAAPNADTAATNKDPEQLREEIEETRRELGATVEALAAKSDVKAHVRDRIQNTRASATQAAQQNPVPLAVAGVFAAGLLVWLLFKR